MQYNAYILQSIFVRMYTKAEIQTAEYIADKYVRLCCEMLPQDGSSVKRYKKCASLLEDIVEDELEAYFGGKSTTLKSVEEYAIMTYIGELFENFIEPMFLNNIAKKNMHLPIVRLTDIRQVRVARTQKKVSFSV